MRCRWSTHHVYSNFYDEFAGRDETSSSFVLVPRCNFLYSRNFTDSRPFTSHLCNTVALNEKKKYSALRSFNLGIRGQGPNCSIDTLGNVHVSFMFLSMFN